MLKRSAAIHMTFGAFLVALLFLGFTVAAETGDTSPPLRARQLTGMKVEDSDGQAAGTIRNLVLEMNTGNLRYVVIGYGGYLGMRTTLKLAPVQVMSAATAKSETLAINATTPQWNRAPVFKSSNLTAISERDRAAEITRNFQIPNKDSLKGKDVSLSKTGRDQAPTRPSTQLKFASDIIGTQVVSPKQEKIGEVVDLLVSFGEPRPAIAIISGGRLFHRDRKYAVPLGTLGRSGSKLMLNTNLNALEHVPAFDQNAWESRGHGSPRIYQYTSPAD